MAVVYRHRRLDTNEIFYVGIGKTSRRVDRKDQRNPHWVHTVAKSGFASEIIASELKWEDACELEEFLIGLYGRRDLGTGPLVNMTFGGEGAFGRIMSEDHKRKIGEGQKKAFPKGNIDNLTKAWESNKGRKYSKEERESRNYKKVHQYSLQGIFIKTFENAYRALEETGINHIGRVCIGDRKTAGGFIWSFNKL